jgi:diaminopimelate decarboxylase
VSVLELIAEHGSPLWLCDVDRLRRNAGTFRRTWQWAWPDTAVAYSYKTNRTPAVLTALADEGCMAEVVCEAELALARELGTDAAGIIVNGPAKTPALLAQAAAAGALVLADSAEELPRLAAAGVTRVGLRVAMDGVGVGPRRFGIAPADVAAAAGRAVGLGLRLEALGVHRVSIGFAAPLRPEGGLAESVFSVWPRMPAMHVEAATLLCGLATQLAAQETPVAALDLGGGFPAGPHLEECAAAVADALRAGGFAGRLLLEPGRALVADAVDLAVSVVAVKRLSGGERCIVVDGGTNLVAGALFRWPSIEPLEMDAGEPTPALVTGPLCLNIDVLHPAAELPPVGPGDLLRIRAVGAYHQSQSTQFGDLRPAVVAREAGAWRLAVRRETLDDLTAGIADRAKEVR